MMTYSVYRTYVCLTDANCEFPSFVAFHAPRTCSNLNQVFAHSFTSHFRLLSQVGTYLPARSKPNFSWVGRGLLFQKKTPIL